MGALQRKCHVSKTALSNLYPTSLLVVYKNKKNESKFKITSSIISATYDEISDTFVPEKMEDLTFAVHEFNRLTNSKLPDNHFFSLLNKDVLIPLGDYHVAIIPILTCLVDEMIPFEEDSYIIKSIKEDIQKGLLATYQMIEVEETLNLMKIAIEKGDRSILKNELKEYEKIEKVLDTDDIHSTHIPVIHDFVSFYEMIKFYGARIALDKYIRVLSLNRALLTGGVLLTPSFDKDQTSLCNVIDFHKMLVNGLEKGRIE